MFIIELGFEDGAGLIWLRIWYLGRFYVNNNETFGPANGKASFG
jgi:hypothetical protein